MTGTVDRLVELDRKLSDLRDVLVGIRNSLAEPEPARKIEVGDRISTDGKKYHEVVGLFIDRIHTVGGGIWLPTDVADVYTRAEQEANEALVQIHLPAGKDSVSDHPEYRAVRDDVGASASILGSFPDCQPVWFITAEAAAALGLFTKIDEPIEVGSVVRWGTDSAAVFTVASIERQSGYDYAFGPDRSYGVRTDNGSLTHLAREDLAYPGDADPAPLASQRWDEYRKPAADVPTEPSPDSERLWESWDLITAGDANFSNRGEGEWLEIGSGDVWSTKAVAALGEVRRAVVVTLPNEHPIIVGGSAAGVTRFTVDGVVTSDEFAGILLAAAEASETAQ